MSTFTEFVTSLYRAVTAKHSQTLTDLKECAVRQLTDLSVRRVHFMEDSAEVTISTAEPYNGEWVGAGVTGFPLDILEVDGVYYRYASTSSWQPVDGPLPISDLRTYQAPLAIQESPLSVYPLAWAWWRNRIWVPKLSGDSEIRIDFWRDGTRDSTFGTLISTASTSETNPWLKEGERAMRHGTLADYYSLPSSYDEKQASAELGKRNAYLNTLEVATRMKQPAAIQAPMT